MTDAVPDTTPAPGSRWRLIGPGIVAAATGVGAGDLVATLIAGSMFGYALLWAAVAGTLLKISLAEAVGRWALSSGRTIFDGWSSLGPGWFAGRLNWATLYFGVYVVLWGFVYGATAMTASALPLAALLDGTAMALDLKTWAMICGGVGLVLVWFNRYPVFEKLMTGLVAVMFVTVVGLAVIVAPDLPAMARGLVPTLPAGSAFYTLGLIGGVGGTITLAAYGYWIGEKGWRGPAWMRVMKLDNRVGYAVTGVFVVAMLIVGSELLYASGIALSQGDRGLLDLDDVLRERFGDVVGIMFLVGFFAASFSSLIGVWHGVSLMFADFFAHMRGRADEAAARGEGSPAFRGYLLWLTFPPMALLFMDRPFGLIVAYGALGALFMPFLALTLIWLLNSDRTPAEWRSRWLSNGMLVAGGLLFCVLAGRELIGLFG
ncbi:MAG: Nramp family divalent metal transporter [Alphaproteobacteria bacterium]|jgi:Mn2+/Fe2+ NRAMP family transporter|nr:Nramp family divalent metal transporter [Alphaproteobacteria bacterium]MBU2041662.1 Nramp family divalent metal transporter [Alphaproteobacteria bacterium]MBU2124426.1 Nramp family divalent metal transporter [Alphaproteobacteria bacterium]MBU2208259.1 Nramp family divalent metal transporter [Alphaproteobacteria bacterium]MBU2289846.1 Nramp family divalent metal transporter [Alphaproteobacteria bacterium]